MTRKTSTPWQVPMNHNIISWGHCSSFYTYVCNLYIPSKQAPWQMQTKLTRILQTCIIVNPQCMRRRVTVVVLCVCRCLSVTKLAAAYIVCESKMWCYKVPYGVPIVWISLKTLCLPVLALFADSKFFTFLS